MRKISILLIGLLAFALAGCALISAPPPQNLPTNTPAFEFPTLVVITETPVVSEPTEAVEPTAATLPEGTITLTHIVDLGGGNAEVQWAAEGSFPSGFRLVWSDTNTTPAYPTDTSLDIAEPTASSATFNGEIRKIYYVRVCRIVAEGCDSYSNLGIFALLNPAPTAVVPTEVVLPTTTSQVLPTATTASTLVTTPTIKITSMSDAGTGKAKITWDASGTFAYGFKIVYSSVHNPPVYGSDTNYSISSGVYRSAYVDGTPGTTYYYRLCRSTGSSCDVYSNVYTFTYPGGSATSTTAPTSAPTQTPTKTPTTVATVQPTATFTATPSTATIEISSISNVNPGQATVYWSASGSFNQGFRILYSSTNNPPTLADGSVAETSWNASSGIGYGTFTGTLGGTYYIRVCRYTSGSVDACSSVVPFTLAP